jgi:uncharacterized protein
MMLRQSQKWLVATTVCVAVLAGAAVISSAEKIGDIQPGNYLTDLANVVDAATAKRVNALAAELEKKTGSQIAVVTVNSLEGRPIEDYAVDLFKRLGVGHKDNRGVLLLLAPRDRRYRFEVGYGLEPVINDARAGDIGRAMVPLLRQGNYGAAIQLGVDQTAGLIAADRHITLDHQPRPAEAPSDSGSDLPLWLFVVGMIAVAAIVRAIARSNGRGGRRRPGAWWIGPMGGWGGGWGSGGGSWGGGFGGSSGGFGGFGGGSSGGGGASGSW